MDINLIGGVRVVGFTGLTKSLVIGLSVGIVSEVMVGLVRVVVWLVVRLVVELVEVLAIELAIVLVVELTLDLLIGFTLRVISRIGLVGLVASAVPIFVIASRAVSTRASVPVCMSFFVLVSGFVSVFTSVLASGLVFGFFVV